jgi:hypothetical protein
LLNVVLYNSNANYDKKSHHNNMSYLPAAAESPTSTLGIAFHELRRLDVANVTVGAAALVKQSRWGTSLFHDTHGALHRPICICFLRAQLLQISILSTQAHLIYMHNCWIVQGIVECQGQGPTPDPTTKYRVDILPRCATEMVSIAPSQSNLYINAALGSMPALRCSL